MPTLPLFVLERHSTQAVLEALKSNKALGTNLDLFGGTNLDVADKLDAYEHERPWTNRLILGEGLEPFATRGRRCLSPGTDVCSG